MTRSKITGTLPQGYVELPTLTYLVVSGHCGTNGYCGTNGISGSVIGALGRNIQLADVSDNHVSGHVSPDRWGMMNNVTYLTIRNNKISGTMSPQNQNTGLILFLIMSTLISGSMPADFGMLTSLRYLLARETAMSGICQSYVGQLDTARLFLVVAGSLPPSFAGLTALVLLDLSKEDHESSLSRGSQFEGPLFALLNSSEIRFLHAYGNRFRGHYGCNSSCENMETILVHGNQVFSFFVVATCVLCFDSEVVSADIRDNRRSP